MPKPPRPTKPPDRKDLACGTCPCDKSKWVRGHWRWVRERQKRACRGWRDSSSTHCQLDRPVDPPWAAVVEDFDNHHVLTSGSGCFGNVHDQHVVFLVGKQAPMELAVDMDLADVTAMSVQPDYWTANTGDFMKLLD